MATAKQEGGLYYDSVRDTMVNAEGKEVKGAAKPAKDTPRDEQPAGLTGASTPEERLATAIATALRSGSAGSASASGSASSTDDASLPTVANLADHISKMSVAEVKSLQKSDDRTTAQPIYEARLAELES